MPHGPVLAQDALLSLLFPAWQIAIGVLVLLAVIFSVRTFARRGLSRMTTALLLTGGAVVGLVALSILLQS